VGGWALAGKVRCSMGGAGRGYVEGVNQDFFATQEGVPGGLLQAHKGENNELLGAVKKLCRKKTRRRGWGKG